MRVNAHRQQQRERSSSTESEPSMWSTNTSTYASTSRAKRKSRWKLKFHHQTCAAAENQQLRKAAKLRPNGQPRASAAALGDGRATECDGEAPTAAAGCGRRSTVRYADLPFMGEMTLANAVPRRGRKPKKADICHLVFKNYGTTVVDEPLNLCVRDLRPRMEAAEQPATGHGHGHVRCPPPNHRHRLHLHRGDDDDDDDDDDARIGRFEWLRPSKSDVDGTAPANASSTSAGCAGLRAKRKGRSLGRPLGRHGRKSTARERLRRTFEERGFLIQTQQLQSAQGATYCKFRQLRKFTRYLFRSWKHHLPGDIVDKQQ